MASPLLFGIETEYATSFIGKNGDGGDRTPQSCCDIVQAVGREMPHIEGNGSSDIYLCNGARSYPDAGGHMEYCSPECSDPADLVAAVCAGDQLLEEATRRLAAARPGTEAVLAKGNIDYSGAATWGSHENYLLYEWDAGDIAPDLVPHLVSRIIYSGSGGFRSRWLSAEFTLSPRSWRLSRVISSNTQSCRGIINTKDEPLGDKGQRLHLICGESLCSQLALYLRVATTALVVRLLDLGHVPKRTLRLAQPLAALRFFTSDPTLSVAVPDANGKPVTALDMQHRYLDFVSRYLSRNILPVWAPKAVAVWGGTLDILSREGPAGAALSLDWAIKYALYGRWLERAGFSWKSFHDLGRTMTRGFLEYCRSHEPEEAQAWRSPEDFRQVASWMAQRDICPEERAMSHFDLRLRLFEAETRFARLGTGIFAELDQRGLLRHSAPGVDAARIRRARKSPPRGSRARARGLMIRRLWRKGPPLAHRCTWDGIYDMLNRRVFDLSDNFARWGEWIPAKEHRPTRGRLFDIVFGERRSAPEISYFVAEALRQYDRGDYEAAHQMLEGIGDERRGRTSASQLNEYYRVSAWVNARRGATEEAFGALTALDGRVPRNLLRASDHTCAYRYLGLRPRREIRPAIAEGLKMMRAARGQHPGTEVPFLGHVAYDLLKRGRPKRALRVLAMATEPERLERAHPHTVSRVYAELAEAHRMLGHRDIAWENATRAKQIHEENGYGGDLADFTLTYLAKLQIDSSAAVALLERARQTQLSLKNEMGEARTLVLLARIKADLQEAAVLRERLLQIRARRTALRDCPMLAKLLAHWDDWVAGSPDPVPEGVPDDFWCV